MSGKKNYTKEWAYLDQIEFFANKYGLEFDFVCALIQTESRGDPFTIRFEPYYKWLYKPDEIKIIYDRQGKFISTDTMYMCQKTSWGCMQVMGSLFFELSYHVQFGYEMLPQSMLETEIGLEVGCNYMRKLIEKYKIRNIDAMYAAYNRGSVKLLNGKFINQDNVNNFMKWY